MTRKELAYSYQDISAGVSAFNLVNDDEDKEESNVESEQPPAKTNKVGGFNWRLAYNPKCIILGMAIMTYSSGMAVAYYSIPPLGRDTGQMTYSTMSNSGFCITLFGDLYYSVSNEINFVSSHWCILLGFEFKGHSVG